MTYVKTLTHKGLEITYSDFSNLKELKEIEMALDESANFIRSSELNSVYSLSNFENIYFNADLARKIQAMVSENKPYIKYSAVIGIKGLSKIMLDGIIRMTGRNLKLFATEDEAKDFLLEQSVL